MAERQLLRWKIMEIISVVSKVQTKELQSSNGPFEIRYQEADLIMPNRRARALEIRAPRDGEYPPGLYILAAESFSITNGISLPLSPIARGTAPGQSMSGMHGDRIQPELALGINRAHGGAAVAFRRSVVKVLNFLRSVLKTG